jgi:hypothetical protein
MRRKSVNNFKRKINFRDTRKRFLIVCEGEKTEPNYFRKFRVPTLVIDVFGEGYNTDSLLKVTIEYKKQDSYDEVWCVFDRDSFPAENFNNALILAQKHKIKAAYSNEAFELWYILHFHYHDAATSRNEYKRILTQRLGFEYKKNDPDIYDHLLAKQSAAIHNSTKLLSTYINHSPVKDNPCTTVHILVQELNKSSV